jgi:hypothetical protein
VDTVIVRTDLPEVNAATVAKWLALFVRPGDVAELRGLHVQQRYGRPQTVAGFFDGAHLDEMAREALALTSKARGVYFTLNPLKPEILARCANRTKNADTGDLASDHHVARRRWLLCDVDAVRLAGIGATDAEKTAALDVVNAIRHNLDALGWPAPILADSGNGFHLFYPLDLPAADGGVVERCLAALASRFDTDAAKVDKAVHNAARIVKVPGTEARKGDATIDRPHRRGAILDVPAELRSVPPHLLDALAAEAPPAPSASVPSAPPVPLASAERNGGRNHRLDVPRWLRDRGIGFRQKEALDAKGRTVFALDACPFNPDHKDAAVFQAVDGKLGFHCFHDSCGGRGWQDCKETIGAPDPDHFDPPLRGRKRDRAGDKEGGSHAALLVGIGLAGFELFHDSDTAYATRIGTAQTVALASRAFREKLAYAFFVAKGRVPSGEALRAALDTLAGKAKFEGSALAVRVRLAELDGAIYLDLGREDWAAVRITTAGWELVTQYPVRFRHPRGLQPLPLPTPGGNLDALRDLLNLESEHDWRLIVGWLLAALRPSGPYPVLVLTGEQGSAKSTTARLLRSLVDPNAAPLRSQPRDGRDLVIAAGNSWILALDNLSYIPPWLSDCLCRLATGGGFATRELYTDAEEVLFDSQRPVILTSIEDVCERGDLLDRALIVRLPAIPEEKRRPESEFWAGADAVRPAILGALLDAVRAGLATLPRIHLDRLPRMADFATWGTACEPGLSWPPGAFLDAYAGNVADANELALDGSPLWPALRQLVDSHTTWEGTATALLDELGRLAGDKTTAARGWPKKPHVLTGRLRRLAPNLRRAGVQIDFGRAGGRRNQKRIRLEAAKVADGASEASEASENPKNVAPVRTLADASEGTSDGSRTLPAPVVDRGKDGVRTLADASDASSDSSEARAVEAQSLPDLHELFPDEPGPYR